MLLNLSPSLSVLKSSVIGIFDMDSATTQQSTRAFLRNKEKNKKLLTTASDIPKSFVVTDDMVYLVRSAPLSLKTHL